MAKVYRNSTELMRLAGEPIYLEDIAEACLVGKLNLFLQGDTGSGKTQLARDIMGYFGDKSMFILGRNDMDTRELFQQINLEKLRTANSSSELKELTDKVNYHLIVVDEMPNCVPSVRAQLFNLFDGFIEINGQAYPIGNGYSVGIATGNVGQKFTESSNDLGRALKDRMHVIVDTDYFPPTEKDTLNLLAESTNPRVEFTSEDSLRYDLIINQHKQLVAKEIPLEKLIIANYFIHGMDFCSKGSKRKMKEAWPTELENHEQGSDVGLVLPISTRAAKSVLRLSQSLDQIILDRGVSEEKVSREYFWSMMQAYKFVSAYSGILNESAVDANYSKDRYKALDAVIATTRTEFESQKLNIAMGLEMVSSKKTNSKILNKFTDRWQFMRGILEELAKYQQETQ